MRKLMLAGLLALGVVASGNWPARAVDQEAINRAIQSGVAYLRTLKKANGSWPHAEMGATALAGLTLLECDVADDDKDVVAAAEFVRGASISCTNTYSISLAIMFLDRLGSPADVPLIESLTVRLLAGQTGTGGWTYTCPPISDAEVRRLSTVVKGNSELVGRAQLPKPDGKRRTIADVSPEIKSQLIGIGGYSPMGFGDNSNTQFATIALWIARRSGLPADTAIGNIDRRYRGTQQADGGWLYIPPLRSPDRAPSLPAMTCAGALGITVAHGAIAEVARGKARAAAIDKDPALQAALAVLSTTVGNPAGDLNDRSIPRAGGKSYYFLWSLERLCMALGLETLDKKDWYSWGAEILLVSQGSNGCWSGEFASSGADTCFALLFLKRSNLVRDLSAGLKGKLKDSIALKSGGVGGAGLKGIPKKLKPGIETESDTKVTPPPIEKKLPPIPDKPEGPSKGPASPLAGLAEELVKAPDTERAAVLQKLRDGKGVEFTEALASAIPHLSGAARQDARAALSERLARKTAETLKNYLGDDDPEIRRAAALACASKGMKNFVPLLIPLLRDRSEDVGKAACVALKELTGQDLGTSPTAWKEWWDKQQ